LASIVIDWVVSDDETVVINVEDINLFVVVDDDNVGDDDDDDVVVDERELLFSMFVIDIVESIVLVRL